VVLLDMVAKGQLLEPGELVVAHFDHGIRGGSARDAEFVQKLATKYGLEFRLGQGHLGPEASEDLARRKRYEFLKACYPDPSPNLVRDQNGESFIVTAHHQDDLLETIAMNLIRGSGWRGLAPFASADIMRPLLGLTKAEIVNYAIENNLNWVEDETNYSAKYFRNRVRNLTARLTAAQRQRLLELNQEQIKLRGEIENLLESSLTANAKQSSAESDNSYKIKELTKLPTNVAIEILRQITGAKLTTPQLKRLLKNLGNAKSGDIFQPGGKIQIGVYRGQITITRH